MANQNRAVYRAFASQVRQLQGVDVSDAAIDSFLSALTAGATSAVSTATYACITVVENGVVTSLAPTDEVAGRLDELQAKHDVGPCLESAWRQRVVRVDDYDTDDRWPEYISDARMQTPVRASVSFPLFRESDVMGALTLHSVEADAFDPDAVQIGRTFAAQAALAMQSDTRQHQFSEALASRDTIGQAKGILMERYDLDADQAFAMLRQVSQDTNDKIVDLAARLVTLDHPPRTS